MDRVDQRRAVVAQRGRPQQRRERCRIEPAGQHPVTARDACRIAIEATEALEIGRQKPSIALHLGPWYRCAYSVPWPAIERDQARLEVDPDRLNPVGLVGDRARGMGAIGSGKAIGGDDRGAASVAVEGQLAQFPAKLARVPHGGGRELGRNGWPRRLDDRALGT